MILSDNIFLENVKIYHYFYKITNLKNNKFYYGVHSTDNLDDGYMGSGTIIKRIIKRYGKEYLKKDILKYFENSEDMFEYEKRFITEDVIKDPKCYNLTNGGNGYSKNHYVTDEVRNKISEKRKNTGSKTKGYRYVHMGEINKMVSPEDFNKYIEDGWVSGIYYSPESRKRLASMGMKGKKMTEEQRKKLSDAKKGKPSPLKGKKMTEEQRKKLSDINTGKKLSKETIEKISNANRGKKRSKETKEKISNANKGKLKGKKISNDVLNNRILRNQEYKIKNGVRVCLTNGINNKFIGEFLVDDFLEKNPEYYIGITKNYKRSKRKI